MKKLLLVFAFALAVLPSQALADASVVQDSCVAFIDENSGKTFATIHFSIVNFSLPAPLSGINMEPEPLPVLPECEMLQCSAPAGWVCSLKLNGGATFGALAAANAIPIGDALSGFSFLLDPGFCCYVVKYFAADGTVLLEQEECFCETPVQTESTTWGQLKGQYR